MPSKYDPSALVKEIEGYLAAEIRELVDVLADVDDGSSTLKATGFLSTGHRLEITLTVHPIDPDTLNN
jgi:hypothetical protein